MATIVCRISKEANKKMNVNIDISIEDYTIIVNALHYYKKAEKKGNFIAYDEARVNQLRDHLCGQFMKSFKQIGK